jgi:hypothetical protein
VGEGRAAGLTDQLVMWSGVVREIMAGKIPLHPRFLPSLSPHRMPFGALSCTIRLIWCMCVSPTHSLPFLNPPSPTHAQDYISSRPGELAAFPLPPAPSAPSTLPRLRVEITLACCLIFCW